MTYFDSSHWWDETGPFRLLHLWIPLRMQFILDHLRPRLESTHGETVQSRIDSRPLTGWTILDVGCGGGLVSEPLARLGAKVMGIDPAPGAIACAEKHHADQVNTGPPMDIVYRCHDPMDWICPEPVDAVILFEILEHIQNPFALIQKMLAFLRPGGVIIGSTVNRTHLSALLGIAVPEYLLKWVPEGTHRWTDFLKPEEITGFLNQNDAIDSRIQGCFYCPGIGWRYSPLSAVNYFFSARLPHCGSARSPNEASWR